MAAVAGSGYGSSLYAGYSAWNSKHADDIQAMEFLSLSHSRASTLHLVGCVPSRGLNDVLNLARLHK